MRPITCNWYAEICFLIMQADTGPANAALEKNSLIIPQRDKKTLAPAEYLLFVLTLRPLPQRVSYQTIFDE